MSAGVDADDDGTRHSLGRILVIEGSREWGQTVSDVLRFEGFETVACNAGAEAKAQIGHVHPELVLMAAEVTDVPASDLCSWIRARSAVPIVVVAQSRPVDAVLILDLGADVVLTEPIGRNELLARVRAILRRRPAPHRDSDVVIHGDASLSRADHTLHLLNGSLRLEGRELALVEALMRNGAKVTARSALQALLCISGPELDCYVRRLRQRLELVEDWRRIVSERGVGYRLLERRPKGAPPRRGGEPQDPAAARAAARAEASAGYVDPTGAELADHRAAPSGGDDAVIVAAP